MEAPRRECVRKPVSSEPPATCYTQRIPHLYLGNILHNKPVNLVFLWFCEWLQQILCRQGGGSWEPQLTTYWGLWLAKDVGSFWRTEPSTCAVWLWLQADGVRIEVEGMSLLSTAELTATWSVCGRALMPPTVTWVFCINGGVKPEDKLSFLRVAKS